MKKIKKKLASLGVAMMITVSSLSIFSFAEEPDDKEMVIDELISRRRSVSLSIKVDSDKGLDTSELESEANDIDNQLARIGVEELASQEVLDRFGNNDEGIVQYATCPDADNVRWVSYRNEQTYNGVTYEIQTLLAMVKDMEPSNLRETGVVTLQSKNKWEAAALEVWKLTEKKGIYFILNSNKYTKIVKNIYEYANAVIKGINGKTVIRDVTASYMYNAFTTASFKFVKKKGDPDSKQMCTYISTECEVALQGSFPSFYCENGVNHPDIVSFNERMVVRPDGYNNNYYAVKAFDSVGSQATAYVDGLDIYGLEGRKLVTVCKLCPRFIAHIY